MSTDDKTIYKVVEEWSRPVWYAHNDALGRILHEESEDSIQSLWVVKYNTNTQEIEEWCERFYADEDDEAEARAKELNEKGV